MTKRLLRKTLSASVLGFASAALLLVAPARTSASVGVGASLDELVRSSNGVAVVTPLDARSEWQDGRIVTFHRLRVESLVSGTSPGSEVVVATLGGRVGKVAQVVEGEAAFPREERSLVFLRALSGGRSAVTARAQGQFRLRTTASGRFTLIRNGRLGKLVAPRGERGDVAALSLHGVSYESGVERIVTTWGRIHAR